MLTVVLTLTTSIILNSCLTNAQAPQSRYTVWSSVIFARTGERTPRMLGNTTPQLTSLGAQQQYDLGMFFRSRYLLSQTIDRSSIAYDSLADAPLQNLDRYSPNPLDVVVGALDTQYSGASAQAFLQGFYPPAPLNATGDSSNNTVAVSYGIQDEFIEAPLQGYQYSQISTYGPQDPNAIYVAGYQYCPSWSSNAVSYTGTPEYAETEAESQNLYNSVGAPFLLNVLPQDSWNYLYAWEIYDYLNYLSSHDASAQAVLASDDNLESLRYYSDESNWARLGNLSAVNDLTGIGMPSAITSGSVSTIAGNMLAYEMLDQLRQAIQTDGQANKISLMFGEFEPMTSLFAVLGLDKINTNFRGMPQFASAAVFELFTQEDPSNPRTAFPDPADLWVNFFFRNGTDGNYTAYPILGHGPDSFQLPWPEFLNEMWSVALGEVADWCSICGSPVLFCSAWTGQITPAVTTTSGERSSNELSPAIAGLIGAIVALAVAGILFGLSMLLGGIRLQRRRKGTHDETGIRKSVGSTRSWTTAGEQEGGGFKGSRKLASDQDLVIPKNGVVSEQVMTADDKDAPLSPICTLSPAGHERQGSWELQESPSSPGRPAANTDDFHLGLACRPSFERDDQHDAGAVDPFANPVRPDDRV